MWEGDRKLNAGLNIKAGFEMISLAIVKLSQDDR